MRTINYDEKDKYTGSTETHFATDLVAYGKAGNLQNSLEEGFSASSGVRGITAATGGRVISPENEDAALPHILKEVDEENAGLADN